MDESKFFVRLDGRQWHIADRVEVRVARRGDLTLPKRLVIVYTLRCSDQPVESASLSDIETELPEGTLAHDICGHTPCARWKKKLRARTMEGWLR